jgi:putative Ig domain-containing protein
MAPSKPSNRMNDLQMKKFLHSRNGACRGAALIIVLGLVVIAAALGLTYFSRSTTDRQLAQTSYNDTSADLLARSALDIVVSDFKQEIINANNAGLVNQSNIQPQRSGDHPSIPNLIRRSVRNDPIPAPPGVPSLASAISSGPIDPANPRRGEITFARWNSHYLIPLTATFTAPDWVLVTGQGPDPAPMPNAVIGRYAFAVYDEGGLINMNLGGFPIYANVTPPTPPGRKLRANYPSEESEIMLAAFTPNDNCHPPKFTPEPTNTTIPAGQPCSLLFNTNGDTPQTFSANFLPQGLTINTTNGNITGTPTSPGQWTITLTVSNGCPPDDTGTLHLTVTGFPFAETTPWPVNLARKGTVAFADLAVLPPNPTSTQINKIMGWRNYATTQQPTSASFDNPSFLTTPTPTPPPPPSSTPPPDSYARYFLGAIPPFFTPFTTVPTMVRNGLTDQAMMTRQELIRLQRTIGFDQSLLQYLGTFSREYNRPAPSWSPDPVSSRRLATRWDMNNLQLVLPTPWFYPGNHGQGHAYGKQRLQNGDLKTLFGFKQWVPGTFRNGDRFTDPNYYGHWLYDPARNVDQLPVSGDPDFFQVIDYALKLKNGGVSPDRAKVFTIGAAIIDQYDTDDLFDTPLAGSETGNTVTIIDYLNDGKPENYAYGVEAMSFDNPGGPTGNENRPPFAPGPDSPPLPSKDNYTRIDRRFENVGEFGYAYNPASTLTSKTLDFGSATSNDTAILDFFTYNSAGNRAGIVNLNTRNAAVLASIIRGAWVNDPGHETLPPDSSYLVSQSDALAAGLAIVQETTNTSGGHGPVLTRADVGRLAAVGASALHGVPGKSADETTQTIARALAEVGQARTWNLMIDVIAQTGNYAPGTPNLSDPTKFVVQGEKRYWLHIALDRDDGTVLGTQLEEVIE